MANWTQPKEVTDAELAFGGDMTKLLPPWSDLPPDAADNWHRSGPDFKWQDIINQWMHRGFPEGTKFIGKEGVSAEKAHRHISAIMVSWSPKHEHKIAGCAWLAEKWFVDVVQPKPSQDVNTDKTV